MTVSLSIPMETEVLASTTAAVQFIGKIEKISWSCNLDLKPTSQVTIIAGKKVLALVMSEGCSYQQWSLSFDSSPIIFASLCVFYIL